MVENSETILSSDFLRETLEAYDRGVAPFNDDSEARDLQAELAEFIASEIEEGVEEAEEKIANDTASQMRSDMMSGLKEWLQAEALGFKLTIQEQEITISLPDALLKQITDRVMELML